MGIGLSGCIPLFFTDVLSFTEQWIRAFRGRIALALSCQIDAGCR